MEQQDAELRFADAHGVLQHRREYRIEIAWRRADDAQHVGGSRLLLQRLAQFAEQPRVLDGDNGLCGEVRQQFDLLIGEWLNILPINNDPTHYLIVPEHRNANGGSRVRERSQCRLRHKAGPP